ncbi:MAG: tetratricopeptide repeat protein [Magnetococcales bacterium]|nr:tetratricopeptide repeat protein [Magnetococcales bacterium]
MSVIYRALRNLKGSPNSAGVGPGLAQGAGKKKGQKDDEDSIKSTFDKKRMLAAFGLIVVAGAVYVWMLTDMESSSETAVAKKAPIKSAPAGQSAPVSWKIPSQKVAIPSPQKGAIAPAALGNLPAAKSPMVPPPAPAQPAPANLAEVSVPTAAGTVDGDSMIGMLEKAGTPSTPRSDASDIDALFAALPDIMQDDVMPEVPDVPAEVKSKPEPSPIRLSQPEPETYVDNAIPEADIEDAVEEPVRPTVVTRDNRLEVARGVQDLKLAMNNRDVEAVRSAFAELERIKGRDNLFLLKMRGFWHLKQRDIPRAGQFFAMAVKKKPDDLEAGFNLALIEMKTNRMEEARTRIRSLIRTHPGDKRLHNVMRYFHRGF